ncbi:unnamed protein product, partial [Meganyctiphanes norvegica]
MATEKIPLLLLLLTVQFLSSCLARVPDGGSIFLMDTKLGNNYLAGPMELLKIIWQLEAAQCEDFGKDYNLQIGLAELGTANPSTPDVELMQTISDKGYDSVWLGASDIQHEGEWLWQDSRQTLYLSNSMWAFGQPSGQSLQNCLEAGYWTEEHNRPYLNDAPCDEASNYYICQVFE